MEQVIWETFGKHLGSISEASEKHLGDIWETFGETWLAEVAKSGKNMEEQYVIVKINVFRNSSFKILTLPGILKVGVNKYRFLQ